MDASNLRKKMQAKVLLFVNEVTSVIEFCAVFLAGVKNVLIFFSMESIILIFQFLKQSK